jgi:hypothetical protein
MRECCVQFAGRCIISFVSLSFSSSFDHNSIVCLCFQSTKSHREPSTLYPVLSKFLVSVFFCALYFLLIDYNSPLPIDSSMNIILQLLYFSLVCFVVRCRFYFVFLLNDSISNAAGLGFEGYHEQNRPKWGLTSNIDILSIELSMNARNSLNSWNITSSRWIRRSVCYSQIQVFASLKGVM